MVPVAEKQNEKKSDRSVSDLKRVVASLLQESGEVAPVDFTRFGKRVGAIIAGGARPGGNSQKYRRQ
jgi:hypothetical protein